MGEGDHGQPNYSTPYYKGGYFYVDGPDGNQYVWTGIRWVDAAIHAAAKLAEDISGVNIQLPGVTYGQPYSEGGYWYMKDSNGDQYVWTGARWADSAYLDTSTPPQHMPGPPDVSGVSFGTPQNIGGRFFIEDSDGVQYLWTGSDWVNGNSAEGQNILVGDVFTQRMALEMAGNINNHMTRMNELAMESAASQPTSPNDPRYISDHIVTDPERDGRTLSNDSNSAVRDDVSTPSAEAGPVNSYEETYSHENYEETYE